jgi:transposase
VRVPAPAEEAVRDLARVRAAVLADRKRAQQRLTATLMRHGRIWREGSYWSKPHRAWIAAQSFTEPALATTLAFYRATLDARESELACIESGLAPWAGRDPLAATVARLGCYWGIAELNALTLAAEVVDWRAAAEVVDGGDPGGVGEDAEADAGDARGSPGHVDRRRRFCRGRHLGWWSAR